MSKKNHEGRMEMNRFQGGKRVGNHLYVRCGGIWIEILALAEHIKENEMMQAEVRR